MKLQSIILIFLIMLLVTTFMNSKNFISGQDATSYHLLVTHYVSENFALPETVPYTMGYGKMIYPPLLYILGAVYFLIFGASLFAGALLCLTFIFLFLLIIFKWSEEENINTFMLTLIIILSARFLDIMTWFYQGPLVIVFSTLFFYFLYKHQKTLKNKFIYYMCISASLAAFSKVTGLAVLGFCFLYIFYYFIQTKKSELLAFFMIINIPNFYWYIFKIGIIGSFLKVFSHINSITNLHTLNPTIDNIIISPFTLPAVILFIYALRNFNQFTKTEKIFSYILIAGFVLNALTMTSTRYYIFIYPLAIFLSAKYAFTFSNQKLLAGITIFILIFLINGNTQTRENILDYTTDIFTYLPENQNLSIITDTDLVGFGWHRKYYSYGFEGPFEEVCNYVYEKNISYGIDFWHHYKIHNSYTQNPFELPCFEKVFINPHNYTVYKIIKNN